MTATSSIHYDLYTPIWQQLDRSCFQRKKREIFKGFCGDFILTEWKMDFCLKIICNTFRIQGDYLFLEGCTNKQCKEYSKIRCSELLNICVLSKENLLYEPDDMVELDEWIQEMADQLSYLK